MTRYIHLDAAGSELAEDAPGHTAVRIEHELLARPIIVTSLAAPKRMAWKQAMKWADSLKTNGWDWRLPTAEEAFFIPDRSVYPATSKIHFPDLEDYEPIWTSTPDAEDPSGCAWYVGLSSGDAGGLHRTSRLRVRAVRAGQ